MNLQVFKDVLLWCAVLDYVILILWFLLIAFVHDGFHKLSNLFVELPVERFNAINYAGLAFFKLITIAFFLVPYVVLRFII